MTTYREFQEELERLYRQAEAARRREKAVALERIRTLIVEYHIFPHELGLGKTPGATSKAVPIKFRNPETGATWSGRGRAPKWLEDKDRSQFAV